MSTRGSISLVAGAAMACLLISCGQESQPPARTYSMGERVTVGHLVYVVYETQWLTHLGTGADTRVPQNRFFLVRLSATNGSGQDVIIPNFTIEDDSGKSYPELAGDQAQGVPQYIGYLHKVRPAEAAQGNALFDAPPRHYKIKFYDENADRFSYVDIPLSFTSESPDMPQVGDTKKNDPQPVPSRQ
ncbi:MAG: DUF4352 domain-containing protein [Acidobacteria bacterium]|nr:DUF4352 domain-containing protein [Acidobacteriota bacterium]